MVEIKCLAQVLNSMRYFIQAHLVVQEQVN